MPFSFKPLPEVYQVEMTSACQLRCPLCRRERLVGERGPSARFLDLDCLARWLERGDFDGSYFVELQMSGEPLLHPGLATATGMLRDKGLLVGASTNGLALAGHLDRVRGLDALTVSVDSVEPERYAAMRPPANLASLEEGVDALLGCAWCPPFVDLQLVFPLGSPLEDRVYQIALVRNRWPDPRVIVRWVWDCSAVEEGRGSFDVGTDLCVNPWTSVSVQCDGTVVSCCYVWGRQQENVYGNLNEESLSEIWGGAGVEALRRSHRRGNPGGHCRTCYLRSPTLLHLGFVRSWLTRRQEP